MIISRSGCTQRSGRRARCVRNGHPAVLMWTWSENDGLLVLSQDKRRDAGPYVEYGSWYKACKVDR